MALYKLEELVAYQLSMDLKQQVFALLYNSPAARDVKLAGQISDAVSSLASDLSEGYYRFNPAEFATFVKYCRSSLQEVRTRLPDGVAKRYYSQADIAEMLQLAERLAKVLGGLYYSLRRQAETRRRRQAEAKRSKKAEPARPRPPRPPRPRNQRPHRPR